MSCPWRGCPASAPGHPRRGQGNGRLGIYSVARPSVASQSRLIFLRVVSVFILLCLGLAGCGTDSEPKRNPWLVIGIDGADWRVIERLWADGKLANLKALADSGTRSYLKTAYSSSPIIWTTLATGHPPETHGITGFTVPTEQGDVPVSSSIRKIPALWNMADRSGLDVAVLGWWASWPAESLNGIVISDRPLQPVERPFSPESLRPRMDAWTATAAGEPNGFGGNQASSNRDQLMSVAARELATEAYDLTLLYYRSVDIECHEAWKYFEPDKFGIRPAELVANRDRIPGAYEAVDRAIGDILARASEHTNVVVISDHGFHAMKREELQILIDMNRVLELLGYVTLRPNGKVDLTNTRVYSFGTAKNRRPKRLRYNLQGREDGGSVHPANRQALREALTRDLARLTYEDGSPVFLVRDSSAREQRKGTDFEAFVLGKGSSKTLLLDGKPIEGIVEHLNRISGTHSPDTHGILIASGPDIAQGADIEGISIFDFAPTLLYGLGLPVADDFPGKVFEALLSAEYRASSPLRRIDTWGTMGTWKQAEASAVDQELIDELQSLGYI